MTTRRERACGRKRIHLSLADAAKEAKKLHKLFKARFTAYACEFCGSFHVGTERSKSQARRRAVKG